MSDFVIDTVDEHTALKILLNYGTVKDRYGVTYSKCKPRDGNEYIPEKPQWWLDGLGAYKVISWGDYKHEE